MVTWPKRKTLNAPGLSGPASHAATAAAGPQYAFCEPVTAVAMGKWHVRAVGPEGLKPGGGVPNEALCGRNVVMGWDLDSEVTPEQVTSLVTPRGGDGHVALCPACAEAWRHATASA